MSEYNFDVVANSSIRLKTAGKYCDRDIVVTSPKVEIPEGYRFVKVASDFNCVRAVSTIDIKSYDWYKSVTVNDIYCVTKAIKSTASGTFTKGDSCSPIISYSNGVISLNRGAIDGSLVVTFVMDVYVALPL